MKVENPHLNIQILTDKNSWFFKYAPEFKKVISQKGNKVEIITDKKDIKKGDILFLLSWFKLLDPSFFKFHKRNVVIHASPLPRGKGWSPLTWQILEGKNKIPLTLFEIEEKVDAGLVYLQKWLDLNGTELLDQIHDKEAALLTDMAVFFIDNWHKLEGKKQKGEESFYPRREPEDSRLDVKKSIGSQFNLLRVVDNEKYPAFFLHKGKRYILKIFEERNGT